MKYLNEKKINTLEFTTRKTMFFLLGRQFFTADDCSSLTTTRCCLLSLKSAFSRSECGGKGDGLRLLKLPLMLIMP
jgi:hypothetical protein